MKEGEVEFGVDIIGSKIKIWLCTSPGIHQGLYITVEQARFMGKKLTAAADFVEDWKD